MANNLVFGATDISLLRENVDNISNRINDLNHFYYADSTVSGKTLSRLKSVSNDLVNEKNIKIFSAEKTITKGIIAGAWENPIIFGTAKREAIPFDNIAFSVAPVVTVTVDSNLRQDGGTQISWIPVITDITSTNFKLRIYGLSGMKPVATTGTGTKLTDEDVFTINILAVGY